MTPRASHPLPGTEQEGHCASGVCWMLGSQAPEQNQESDWCQETQKGPEGHPRRAPQSSEGPSRPHNLCTGQGSRHKVGGTRKRPLGSKGLLGPVKHVGGAEG
jgi:hypothetical protein